MNPLLVSFRTCVAWLAFTGLLVGCGGGGGSGGVQEEDVFYFGPLGTEPKTFTLHGTVRYEDRIAGERTTGGYGFVTTEFKPVRHAVIDVVDEDGQVLQSSRTDGEGRYTLSATGAGKLQLRVLARTDAAEGLKVEVKNPDGELYAVTRYFVPESGDLPLDSDIPVAAMAGAYNILDLLSAAAQFVREKDGAFPPRIVAYWRAGSMKGTYFSDVDDAIYVRGGSGLGIGDTDEFDDDVLLHEFGHFVERFADHLNSPGGVHRLGENTQDLRLAWSEGWASYFGGTVKKWLRENGSTTLSDTTGIDSLYLDTVDATAFIDWVFDADYAGNGNDLQNSYASAETAVAKVLWQATSLFDFGPVWSAYREPATEARPFSLETYWDRWLATNGSSAEIGSVFAARRVHYADDDDGDSAATPTPIAVGTATPLFLNSATARARTLYGAGDVDYFTVNLQAGKRYVIETFGLTNGADTFLEVYPPSSPRLTNDNASGAVYGGTGAANVHDGCALASRITFTPVKTGTHHVRVRSPDALPLAAGRYGSYRLAVSENPAVNRCP